MNDFVGYDTINLLDLYEFDLVSNETVDSEVIIKYSYEAVAKANSCNYFNIYNYDDLLNKYGPKAMKEVNENSIVTKYTAENDIIATTNPYYPTGTFANEIQ